MKKLVPAFAAILLVTSTFAADHESVIRSAIEQMFDGVVAQDLAAITDATYPGLVEKMGGREAMIADLRSGITELKKAGLEVTANEIIEISPVVSAGTELHATVLSRGDRRNGRLRRRFEVRQIEC